MIGFVVKINDKRSTIMRKGALRNLNKTRERGRIYWDLFTCKAYVSDSPSLSLSLLSRLRLSEEVRPISHANKRRMKEREEGERETIESEKRTNRQVKSE